MRRRHCFTLLVLIAPFLGACADDAADDSVSAAPDAKNKPQMALEKVEPVFESHTSKASSPFIIDYKIIGTPIVGSPLSVDLRIESAVGAVPVQLDYRIPDLDSMSFHEAQPMLLVAAPSGKEDFVSERVTLIPQREGRLYFNVSASVETETGTVSSVIAIPIHVGEVSTDPVEHGVIEMDENGEAVRVLTAD